MPETSVPSESRVSILATHPSRERDAARDAAVIDGIRANRRGFSLNSDGLDPRFNEFVRVSATR